MTDDSLLTSLLAAVAAAPDDVPLRLHVAELLAAADRPADALAHCSHVLAAEPGNPTALALLQRLTGALTGGAAPHPRTANEPPTGPLPAAGFDWAKAEQQVADVREPAFAEDAGSSPTEDVRTAERPMIRLSDVGGMDEVKQRLELAFLGPVRNPDMARRFGATARGGLLLYGPPGCGKTFIARAVAGELGARFVEIGIADVLDMWVGSSERNLAEIFRTARRNAPCVLFLDEVDALGRKRSHLTHSGSLRNTVNQLLSEMDSATGANDGVFVLGATNHPWDLDSALRRPGRFDRMLLVLPPDGPARAAILRQHLKDRPVAELDVAKLVKATEHYSGADLAHVCDTAAERALAASMRSGTVRALTTRDLLAAAREVTPSTGPWFAAARNVALFGNTDGSYDDLAAYLKRHRNL
ncbi:26S protease regulatory subunit [Pseudonocardia sp. N23]|uniref:ATP-binding protein n=1 Tax=Pseudonocardia sp. N23 TaxID=1987376 RepID=UPI000BFD8119|nr:ATP-binding protein [Pseudonocardia sp. N23]GAY11038.1 cell division protein FtsH [Pseudonocardia sp. N23]